MNEERRLLRNSMRTPDGTVLVSNSRHDYVSYLDSNGDNYILDGGNEYVRCSVNAIPAVDTSLYTDTPHHTLRGELTWGTYGINGDQPIKYIKVKDMEDAHIIAILDQELGSKDYRNMLRDELLYRLANQEQYL